MTPEELLAECPDLTLKTVVRGWRSPPIGNASWRPFRLTSSEQLPIALYGEVNCSFTHSIVFSASEQIRKTSCTVFGPT